MPETIDVVYQFTDDKDKVELDTVLTAVVRDSISSHILKLNKMQLNGDL